MAERLRKAAKVMRDGGPLRLCLMLLRLAASPVIEFGRVVFFLRELDGTWTTPKLPPGLEVGLAASSDLPRVVSDGRPDPQLPQLCRQRFERGDHCVLIKTDDGTVAHSRWVTTVATAIPELGMSIVPRPGEAYLYDGYTRPDQRSRGIDGVVRCFVFDMLRANGYKRVYSYVRGNNEPGLRAANRWQACVGEIWFLRVRGFRAWLISRRAADARSDASPSLPPASRDRAMAAWPDLI
jgi:ribosomal protein S18 acetylase RimI-like enzyme